MSRKRGSQKKMEEKEVWVLVCAVLCVFCVPLLLRSVGGDGSRGGKEKSSRVCKEDSK